MCYDQTPHPLRAQKHPVSSGQRTNCPVNGCICPQDTGNTKGHFRCSNLILIKGLGLYLRVFLMLFYPLISQQPAEHPKHQCNSSIEHVSMLLVLSIISLSFIRKSPQTPNCRFWGAKDKTAAHNCAEAGSLISRHLIFYLLPSIIFCLSRCHQLALLSSAAVCHIPPL